LLSYGEERLKIHHTETIKMILDLLQRVCKLLDENNIPYMISGSIAMNIYTIPRMTRDIDIVVELSLDRVDEFTDLFPDSYFNKDAIKDEIKRKEYSIL